jgi:hypothetical protein
MELPKCPPARSVLESGEIVFHVRRGGECVTEHKVDLLSLKLTCEECEQSHGLQIADGRIQPTAAFLRDLAGRIQELGVENCTPTTAWQMWLAAAEAMAELKNALSEMPS